MRICKNAHARQLANYEVAETGCWIFKGSLNSHGYGQAHRFGRPIGAHRLFYETHVGPIPQGMLVCHTCDVRSCVNPDHLFIGTHQDNTLDAVSKGRWPAPPLIRHPEKIQRGIHSVSSKLTEKAVLDILATTDSNACAAKRHSISVGCVGSIRAGRNWKHLENKGAPTKRPGIFSRVGKLTLEEAADIIGHPGTALEMATQYGVDRSTIYRIRAGIYYGKSRPGRGGL